MPSPDQASPAAQRLLNVLKNGNPTDHERTILIQILKEIAAGKQDIVQQLRIKAMEFNQSQHRVQPETSLLDYEPCRRIPPMWEYMESRQYLNRKNVYPRIMDILVAVDDPSVREVYIQAGKGVGKSFLSAALMSRGAFILGSYPMVRDVFGVQPEDFIVTLNMSVSANQAQKVVFQKFKSMIKTSACFPGANIGVREIQFQNNVLGLSGHSEFTTFFGFDVFLGVMDEGSWFSVTPENDVAQEIHQGMLSSMLTRFPNDYKLVTISTPKHQEDFLTSRVTGVKEKGRRIPVFTADSATEPPRISYLDNGGWEGINLSGDAVAKS
jgi:hypothetical protein